MTRATPSNQWDHSLPFWHQDVRALLKAFLDDVLTVSQAFLLFGVMSLSVVIPYLVLWAVQTATGRP